MPPEGYDTVTLPTDLVQQLDDLPGDSHTATVRHLVSDYRTEDCGGGDAVPEGLLEVMEATPEELEEIKRLVKEASESVQTVEDRTGSIERTLEDMAGRT